MQAFRTHLMHSPRRGHIERIEDALVSVSDTGVITDIRRGDDVENVTDLRDYGILLPGFVDLHIHAPQFPQLGAALDVPLEEWLFKYTFPLEARYADLAFATEVYERLVQHLLANGTTTAVYFATIHGPTSLKLAEICLNLGQRAWVGRVAMDLADGCPDYYRDRDAKAAVEDTASFIDAVRAMPGNTLVEPVITPRFIPACSDAALEGLGGLVKTTGAPVQTHCSESDWEHGFVQDRMGKTDTAALEDFGLLTRRSVLAHAGHVTEADMDLIASRGAGIAHCPLSNAYFGDATFPLRRALAKALHVGLGTDISGGYSAFLLDNARAAVTHSRMLESGVDPVLPPGERGQPDARIDFRDAFYLATKGGAEVLDLPVGAFEKGRQFDAVLVDFEGVRTPTEEALQKIVLRATPENIKTTWVAGRKVSAR